MPCSEAEHVIKIRHLWGKYKVKTRRDLHRSTPEHEEGDAVRELAERTAELPALFSGLRPASGRQINEKTPREARGYSLIRSGAR
jgi:hypothetical protein